MALMSGKVYSNTGAPNNADGVDGDIYMQLDGFKTTYRKESGAWVAVGSTLGATPEIISGVGAPSNLLGADEQYYRNTENQDIYYKQGSTWNLVGNLTGATFAPVLDQAGDLNTILVSGEYSFPPTVTNAPYRVIDSTFYEYGGVLKVWRETADRVYQFVETTNGLLTSRSTLDGGANWTGWRFAASEVGDNGTTFAVSTAQLPSDATPLAQVKELLKNFYSSTEGGAVNNGTLEFKNDNGGLTQFKFNRYTGGGTTPTVTIAPNSSPSPNYCNGVWLTSIGGTQPTLTSVSANSFTVNNPSGADFFWLALIDITI